MIDWAERWRAKAAELRAMAETARDGMVRDLLLELARDYDRLEGAADRPSRPSACEAN